MTTPNPSDVTDELKKAKVDIQTLLTKLCNLIDKLDSMPTVPALSDDLTINGVTKTVHGWYDDIASANTHAHGSVLTHVLWLAHSKHPA